MYLGLEGYIGVPGVRWVHPVSTPPARLVEAHRLEAIMQFFGCTLVVSRQVMILGAPWWESTKSSIGIHLTESNGAHMELDGLLI